MNFQERLRKVQENQEMKSQESINEQIKKFQENQETCRMLKNKIYELEIPKIFKEIKEEVWKCGEISIQENPIQNIANTGNNSTSIKLSISWPYYMAEHRHISIWNSDGPELIPAQTSCKNLFIEYGLSKAISDNKIIPFLNCNYLNNRLPRDTKENKSFYEIALDKPITNEQKKCIEEIIVDMVKNQTNLIKIIEQDKQEIIQKINSGKLLMKNVPINFFSEDEMKFINPPQKRSFLDKFLGNK